MHGDRIKINFNDLPRWTREIYRVPNLYHNSRTEKYYVCYGDKCMIFDEMERELADDLAAEIQGLVYAYPDDPWKYIESHIAGELEVVYYDASPIKRIRGSRAIASPEFIFLPKGESDIIFLHEKKHYDLGHTDVGRVLSKDPWMWAEDEIEAWKGVVDELKARGTWKRDRGYVRGHLWSLFLDENKVNRIMSEFEKDEWIGLRKISKNWS